MIGALAVLLMVAAQQAQPTTGLCRGVAVPSTTGQANLIAIYVMGDADSLNRFKQAAELLRNVEVIGPRDFMGETAVSVGFRTARNNPEGSSNSTEALRLLNRAEDGEFGALRVEPLIMPIDTLPADRC